MVSGTHRKPGELRDEMTPDDMARECGYSYERSGKRLTWEDFMELLHRRFEQNAPKRRSVSTVERAA